MKVPGPVAITRPLNSIVAGVAALLGYLVATGTVDLHSLLLIPVVLLITAGGNVINDYFDATIDAVNRPDRPIPSGAIRKGTARSLAITLFLAGILLSLFTTPFCSAIAVFNALLLAAYAARLKGMPLIGNAAVSYLSASIFLFGGALAGPGGLLLNVPLAAITFLAMLARELLKDAEDIEGDSAGGARTLPMLIGIPGTARLALACTLLAAGASLIPAGTWGIWYLAGIAAVDLMIIAAAVRALPCATAACVQASGATNLLKSGFFASLLVFAAAAYLL